MISLIGLYPYLSENFILPLSDNNDYAEFLISYMMVGVGSQGKWRGIALSWKGPSLRLAMPGVWHLRPLCCGHDAPDVWLVEDQAGSWLPGGTVDKADFASFKLKELK
jgi:hypothetical protein